MKYASSLRPVSWEVPVDSQILIKRRLVLTLGVLVACGSNPLPEWKTTPTPSATAKRVGQLQRFSNMRAWQQSSYYRLDDDVHIPVYLIVADDRTACIAPSEDWTIAAPGDFYPCPDKWRMARPS